MYMVKLQCTACVKSPSRACDSRFNVAMSLFFIYIAFNVQRRHWYITYYHYSGIPPPPPQCVGCTSVCCVGRPTNSTVWWWLLSPVHWGTHLQSPLLASSSGGGGVRWQWFWMFAGLNSKHIHSGADTCSTTLLIWYLHTFTAFTHFLK